MRRREFLNASLSTAAASVFASGASASCLSSEKSNEKSSEKTKENACCGPTYASPKEAMKAPRETLAYSPAIYTGTPIAKPDYMATVDVDPSSKTYCRVIHRTPMPHPGDELHHFGWNACSSCHGDPEKMRRFLVVPGLASGRIHILDAGDPRSPKITKVIDGEEIKRKTNLSTPHTVHCLPDGQVMISMLGDANGDAPGGFLLLDDQFNIAGKWAKDVSPMSFNYDFWYQVRHNVMVSSEWAAPKTVATGFKVEDVKAGKYGRRLHFWNWKTREHQQTVDLGEEGMIPLEIRWRHDPSSTHGFVGAALSSAVWHFNKKEKSTASDAWRAEKVIQIEPVETAGWPFPVPGLITDLVLSLDDRFLYFANWLHGDVRQYDVSDPSAPKLTGQVWLGGVLKKDGKSTPKKVRGHTLHGGPQMLQLSLDGKRLYLTNSLYSVWDNQFYPEIGKHGSYMLQIDCNADAGGMTLNEDFYVDFGVEPHGPARAHEIRFPGGDCTSDIWV